MAYIVLFFVSLFIFFLIYALLKLNQLSKIKAQEKKRQNAKEKAALAGLLVECPLCGTFLMKGENLITRVYRPMNCHDQLCTVSGCPHCYPKVESGLHRTCPVCKKDVPLDGHLVARLFNYTKEGKKHVRIGGCPNCCREVN